MKWKLFMLYIILVLNNFQLIAFETSAYLLDLQNKFLTTG